MKKKLFKIFGAMLVLSMLASPVVARAPQGERPPLDDPQPAEATLLESKSKEDLKEIGRYIVLLEDNSLVTYRGGVPGLRATSPVAGEKIDVTSVDSVQYLDFLKGKQDAVITAAETGFGRDLAVELRYDVILNGFATELSGAEAQKLASMPGVRAVLVDEMWQPSTDVSPEFIGADTLWDETENTTPGTLETKGEGMLIGVIDTGINMDHPSFADIGGDGYDHENPFGSGNYVGLCANDSSNYVCNDKLVGVYGYTAGEEAVTGEDAEAHGSHTASTAAGNYLELDYNGVPVTISGMAPHANIIAYDVCYSAGCPNSYSVEAVEQAVIDGVDVLNYSIGPNSAVNPYENAVELAMLEAIDAGVLTSTSAGNSGPDARTVFKAPAWNLNVANTSHTRIFGISVNVHEPGGPASLYEAVAMPSAGVNFSSDVLNHPLRWAGDDDLANVTGCDPFSTDFFTGSIALVSRGGCTFQDKEENAADAGADGLLVYNNAGGPPFVMGYDDPTTIPSAMIDKEDGEAIVALMSSSLMVDIDTDYARDVKDIWGNVLSSSSSRGPFELLDILAPEVSAPGTNVLAAYNTPGESAPYGGINSDAEIDLMSGTSMASPHGAGSALLLMDLFPDWTPLEIKSAIVMSAYDETTVKEDGLTPTDPFDDGNGRIDLTKAALIGLVMDETVANFTDANPAEGGDVKTLNVPSYQNSQCVGECSFTRTVKNVADVDTYYDVVIDAPAGVGIVATPASFTIPVGGTQEVLFEIDVQGAEMGTWQFAKITFDTSDAFTTSEPITDARFQIAVMPDPGNIPALVEEEVYRDAGGVVLEDLYSIEITDLTVETAGLTEADLFEFSLAGDPTNADESEAFDDLGDVWYTTFMIPEGTKRVVMEILQTTASDLDLYFGYGPTPSLETLWDYSANGAALEYLSWVDPIDYQWWVLVQNWGGDPAVLDDVKLAVGLVPDVESTNFDVSGPSSNPALTMFDLELTWDVPDMEPFSAWYGWFNVGSDPGNPGNIGETELNVYRPYDDVVKEVSADYADVGDTLTYAITIAPNETGADLDYLINDVLPDGVEYVSGSVNTVGSTTMATYDVGTNAIQWAGTMPKIEYTYFASDNTTDPNCDTPWGGYLDIETVFGFSTMSSIAGDTQEWSFSGFGVGTEYYGEAISSPPIFNDDGFAYMNGYDAFWLWTYQNPFPDPTPPNGIVSSYMRDMYITYDELLNKGVTAVSFSGGAIWVIEFDDIEDYYDPTATMDYQMWAYREVDPSVGTPDISIAFDNVNGDWDGVYTIPSVGVTGLENADGSMGTTYGYFDYTPASGDVVCFDFAMSGADPVVITFDVEVTTEEPLLARNSAMHTANGLGMVEEEAFALTGLNAAVPVADPQSLSTDEETPLNVTLTGSELTPGPVTWTVVDEPEHGTLSGTAPDLVYTPDTDFYGDDSFTFYVNDGVTDSNVATIDIEVTNVNDSPYAEDDYYETEQDQMLDVPAPGVMDNDYDNDPTDDVFVELRESPSHGDLVINADGSFTYYPDEGFFGEDSFSYYLMGIPERAAYVDDATVFITVTPAFEYFFPVFEN